jgi:hypothetical protein
MVLFLLENKECDMFEACVNEEKDDTEPITLICNHQYRQYKYNKRTIRESRMNENGLSATIIAALVCFAGLFVGKAGRLQRYPYDIIPLRPNGYSNGTQISVLFLRVPSSHIVAASD